jgi:Bacterial aa3 type cytochrome c oxidase subunit IV
MQMATKHASGHHADDHGDGHPAMDYAEHNRTYSGFVKGTIGLIVACVLILGGMAAFLV